MLGLSKVHLYGGVPLHLGVYRGFGPRKGLRSDIRIFWLCSWLYPGRKSLDNMLSWCCLLLRARLPSSKLPASKLPPSKLLPSKLPHSRLLPANLHPLRLPLSKLPSSRPPPSTLPPSRLLPSSLPCTRLPPATCLPRGFFLPRLPLGHLHGNCGKLQLSSPRGPDSCIFEVPGNLILATIRSPGT